MPLLNEFILFISKHIKDTVIAVLILVIGLWLSKTLTKVIFNKFGKLPENATQVKFLSGLVNGVLSILVILLAINYIGIATASFVAIIASAGLAIGLALQGSLANFASGVMLAIFKPIKIGDYIEVSGLSGTIEEIGIFVTAMITDDNRVIYIPNSKITDDSIINYFVKGRRRVDMIFGVSLESDITKAKKIISEMFSNDDRILKDPPPIIVIKEIVDSSVKILATPWVNSKNYWELYFDYMQNVKSKFDENEIILNFSQSDIQQNQIKNEL